MAKLGGLAMPDNGFGWHQRDRMFRGTANRVYKLARDRAG